MSATESFKKPDEKTMLTAMVLQQLKDVLEQQKSHVAVIQAQATNDYYWAMFDPLDEQQWFDEEYGDIREIPMFGTGIADEKQKVLELLKDNGIIKNLKVNATNEDPENMGWKDYVVINSFEVEANLTKFLRYYDKYMKAAQPALEQYLIQSGRLPVEQSNKISKPASITRRRKVELHPLTPEHYKKSKGVLYLNTEDKVLIALKGKSRRPDGRKYEQCYILERVFKTVKTMKQGVKTSTLLGVKDDLVTQKNEHKIQNNIDEINKKIKESGGPINLIKLQKHTVFINNSYL